MLSLTQEKVWFPFQIGYTYEMLDIGNICRSGRGLKQSHTGFLWGAIPLSIVAVGAGADEVFPYILSPQFAGDDMIHGKGFIRAATILAPMSIPFQYVSAGENYPPAGAGDKEYQPHHTGKGIDQGYGMDEFAILLHYLRLT